ncbi:MAG: single-stranded-DNA-specific exonuclease RecJ [Planctomycetaceae bacterium]|nr:single-stranded-DNA-specific exonuclease RecJ [Planctomycetaceae bacterium]
MARNWRFAPHDTAVVARLARDLRCSPLLARVLASRGQMTREDALAFLRTELTDLHDPALLPGVPEAADLIVDALTSGRRITIYGDYDVDGVTATSILWHCLTLAGGKVDYYIPSRLEEGYGLNCDAVRLLHEEDPERLVVTVDCGIASVKEAVLARELGLDLIITDHHNFAEELPAAKVLVHPRLPDTKCPFTDLCGAGVAFKLAWAISQRLGDGQKASPKMRQFLISAVGLAAMGTVADLVPLHGENRILVSYGLKLLGRSQGPGLDALMQVAKLTENTELSSEDIGFGLAPRINAAGRLGQARLAVELLTTDNEQRAISLANHVDQLNQNRQTVERRIYKQAKELVADNKDWEDDPVLVLAHPDWHPGVIGIVASRVAERFERPTVLIALNEEEQLGQGSGRSFAEFDLHAGLTACRDHLVSFGGHKAAAGVRVMSENIEAFRDALVAYTKEHHRPTDRDVELRVDAEISFNELTHGAVKDLDRLGPFGMQNRRPVFSATHVELVEPPRKMGGGDRHLSLRVKQSGKVFRAVAFGKSDWADQMEAVNGPLALCFEVNINRFRGYENVELRLIDWKPSGSPSEANTSAASLKTPTPAG